MCDYHDNSRLKVVLIRKAIYENLNWNCLENNSKILTPQVLQP
jgi:hypothetical protein